MNETPHIAAMTVFCNELFRLDAWKQYYQEYSQHLSLHVIINNGDKAHSSLLRTYFQNSIVIENDNSNLLTAYNLGLSEILRHPEINAIMQITNDVRFAQDAIPQLWDTLRDNQDIGIVGPVLFKKDSVIIESYGWTLHKHFGGGTPLYYGADFNELALGSKEYRTSIKTKVLKPHASCIFFLGGVFT